MEGLTIITPRCLKIWLTLSVKYGVRQILDVIFRKLLIYLAICLGFRKKVLGGVWIAHYLYYFYHYLEESVEAAPAFVCYFVVEDSIRFLIDVHMVDFGAEVKRGCLLRVVIWYVYY